MTDIAPSGDEQPAPAELYLVVSCQDLLANEKHSEVLSRVLGKLPVSAVLLDGPDGCFAGKDAENRLHPVIEQIQRHDCAVMVSNSIEAAKILKADGIHLNWRTTVVDDYDATRGLAGGQIMIGADAGKSRHDAMIIAERGADYIAFGVPETLKDQDSARQRQVDLISWWSELFEIPVVAFDIHTIEQARAAIAAGADFVAATMPPHSADQSAVDSWVQTFADVFPPKQS